MGKRGKVWVHDTAGAVLAWTVTFTGCTSIALLYQCPGCICCPPGMWAIQEAVAEKKEWREGKI